MSSPLPSSPTEPLGPSEVVPGSAEAGPRQSLVRVPLGDIQNEPRVAQECADALEETSHDVKHRDTIDVSPGEEVDGGVVEPVLEEEQEEEQQQEEEAASLPPERYHLRLDAKLHLAFQARTYTVFSRGVHRFHRRYRYHHLVVCTNMPPAEVLPELSVFVCHSPYWMGADLTLVGSAALLHHFSDWLDPSITQLGAVDVFPTVVGLIVKYDLESASPDVLCVPAGGSPMLRALASWFVMFAMFRGTMVAWARFRLRRCNSPLGKRCQALGDHRPSPSKRRNRSS